MFCRRRRLCLVALLSGFAWFLLLPSFSYFTAKSNLIHDDTSSLIVVNDLNVRKESESRNRKIRQAGRNVEMQMEDKDDDLSEIDYFRPEEHRVMSGKGVKDDRLNVYHTSRLWTSTIRRQRVMTPLQEEKLDFKLPSATFKSPGYKGRMVRVDRQSLSADELKAYDAGWKTYLHNEHVNNLVPTQRVLPDVRNPLCRSVNYSAVDLPGASIVIVFYNEAWNTLLRTVHSVLDRSPAELLTEIILVDDASTHEHLKSQLSNYMSHRNEVRIVRLMTHKGASHARHIGASLAKAKVIVFLDAHCECTTGWLEPLIEHVARNTSSVALPVLDIIDDDTFAYRAYDWAHIRIGSFDWSLAFKWSDIPDHEKERRDNEIDPIRNPVMWGGIFAISRNFLSRLGGFDQSLSMYGSGQNLEMSLRIWMCGGSVETIPCSHVGHIFHQRSEDGQSFSHDATVKNYAAIAHMWLDDFKDLHFERTRRSHPEMNNSAEHWALRERLHCHSFDRYLRNVHPDLFAPSLSLASGRIRSKMRLATGEGKVPVCVNARIQDVGKPLDVVKCRSLKDKEGLWMLSRTGEIRMGSNCLDYPGSSIFVFTCHGGRGNQEWTYREDRTIRQVGTKRCLTLSTDAASLLMDECNGSDHQIWYWKRLSKGSDADRSKDKTKPLVKQELAAIAF